LKGLYYDARSEKHQIVVIVIVISRSGLCCPRRDVKINRGEKYPIFANELQSAIYCKT